MSTTFTPHFLLGQDIAILGLEEETIFRLRAYGVSTVEQLTRKSRRELKACAYWVGEKKIREIEAALAKKGLKLAPDRPLRKRGDT